MPYFSWQLKVMCMRKPIYDLIIGNIEGSGKADDPDLLWKPEGGNKLKQKVAQPVSRSHRK